MLGLLYSIVSYCLFLGAFTYFAVFSDGIIVPKTVDSGMPTSIAVATIINLTLILLFGLQHSIMARASFKRALTRVIPPALERATFVLASSLVLSLVMWQWRPLASVLAGWPRDFRPGAPTDPDLLISSIRLVSA
jgi:protein-S-isoprenylcysteine O-methyltransferase Ste14